MSTEDPAVTNFRAYLQINTVQPNPDYGERELKLELENFILQLYKDCSLSSVKNLTNNQSLLSSWWVNIKLQASFIYI